MNYYKNNIELFDNMLNAVTVANNSTDSISRNIKNSVMLADKMFSTIIFGDKTNYTKFDTYICDNPDDDKYKNLIIIRYYKDEKTCALEFPSWWPNLPTMSNINISIMDNFDFIKFGDNRNSTNNSRVLCINHNTKELYYSHYITFKWDQTLNHNSLDNLEPTKSYIDTSPSNDPKTVTKIYTLDGNYVLCTYIDNDNVLNVTDSISKLLLYKVSANSNNSHVNEIIKYEIIKYMPDNTFLNSSNSSIIYKDVLFLSGKKLKYKNSYISFIPYKQQCMFIFLEYLGKIQIINPPITNPPISFTTFTYAPQPYQSLGIPTYAPMPIITYTLQELQSFSIQQIQQMNINSMNMITPNQVSQLSENQIAALLTKSTLLLKSGELDNLTCGKNRQSNILGTAICSDPTNYYNIGTNIISLPLTITFWFKCDGFPKNMPQELFAYNYDNYGKIRVELNNTRLFIYVQLDGVEYNNKYSFHSNLNLYKIKASIWYHIVIIIDYNNSIKLYVNGKYIDIDYTKENNLYSLLPVKNHLTDSTILVNKMKFNKLKSNDDAQDAIIDYNIRDNRIYINSLNSNQLNGVKNISLQNISPSLIPQLGISLLTSFDISKIQSLTSEQVQLLSTDQLSALLFILKPEQLNLLKIEQVNALYPEFRKILESNKISYDTTNPLANPPANQFALPATTITTLTTPPTATPPATPPATQPATPPSTQPTTPPIIQPRILRTNLQSIPQTIITSTPPLTILNKNTTNIPSILKYLLYICIIIAIVYFIINNNK